MELRHIRYFIAVAEERNFTRAAARIGIAQPPLSQQIQALEKEVGAALFFRVPQGAQLTPAGIAFLGEARAILTLSERAKVTAKRAAAGESGILRLGFTSTSMFNPLGPRIIRAFRKAHRDVVLEFQDGNSTSLAERVLADELDAAFVRPNKGFPPKLAVEILDTEPFVIAMPASHPLAARRKVRLDDLASEPFVVSRSIGMSFLEAIVTACMNCGFAPTVGQEANTVGSTVSLVAAGFGVALVPASVGQIKLDGVLYREILGTPPAITFALVTRKAASTPLVQNLLAAVTRVRKDTVSSQRG